MDLFDDSEDEIPSNNEGKLPSDFEILGWEEASPAIRGLYVRRGYLSQSEQYNLEQAMRANWIRDGMNQGMCFGKFPESLDFIFNRLHTFLSALPASSYPALTAHENPAPRHLWKHTRPFTQLIANFYSPGEGIKEHVDLRQFSEGIVSLSLLSSVPMVFRPVCKSCPKQDPLAPFRSLPEFKEYHTSMNSREGQEEVASSPEEREESRLSRGITVWLHPGDLLVLQDEARWDWTHEIEKKTEDPDPSSSSSSSIGIISSTEMLKRQPRMSLTMRTHNFNPETGRSRLLERWEELNRLNPGDCNCIRCR